MGGVKIGKYLSLLVAFIIVICNVIVDHFFAPTGILSSCFVVTLAASLLFVVKDSFNPLIQCILTYLLLANSDIGIKLYGGGIHDSEGQGFVNLFFLVVAGLSFIIVLTFVLKKKELSIYKKITLLVFFVLLVFLHLYFFSNLGLDRNYT